MDEIYPYIFLDYMKYQLTDLDIIYPEYSDLGQSRDTSITLAVL